MSQTDTRKLLIPRFLLIPQHGKIISCLERIGQTESAMRGGQVLGVMDTSIRLCLNLTTHTNYWSSIPALLEK